MMQLCFIYRYTGFGSGRRDLRKKEGLAAYCSLKSNLANFKFPDTLTTDSESSWHGDFENRLGYGLASCATICTIH